MNKYYLGYPNVRVNLFTVDNSMSVGSRANNNLQSDIADIDDCDDLVELLDILKGEIYIDQINYEEWQCNSDYYKKDSRWKG